jgi:uncharacterized protein YggE
MKKLFAMLFVLLIALSACGLADTEITAQGSAVLTADPDLARVSCGANVRAGSVAQAQQKVTAVIEQVTARLEALGIAKEDIVTDYYGYYPVYDYSDPQGEPEITGYQANHSLIVTCRDVSMLDEVVSAMSDGGMTEFNSIAFDCTGRHELYLEALKRAVEAAREALETDLHLLEHTISTRLDDENARIRFDELFEEGTPDKGKGPGAGTDGDGGDTPGPARLLPGGK